MEAIIYTRTSTASQSHSRQIYELKAIPGFKVRKVFTESISGFTKSIDDRPELQTALTYMKANDIECLMVHEISRLGRRTAEVLTLIEKLKTEGTKVYVKSMDLMINGNGAGSSVNKLIITLMADLARMESEQMSYRIKSGLEERKRKGFAVGRKYGSVESREKFLKKHRNVIKYLERGESIRWISNKLAMSPTTVQKVKKLYNEFQLVNIAV